MLAKHLGGGSQIIHEKMKSAIMVIFISNSAFIPLPQRNFKEEGIKFLLVTAWPCFLLW